MNENFFIKKMLYERILYMNEKFFYNKMLCRPMNETFI